MLLVRWRRAASNTVTKGPLGIRSLVGSGCLTSMCPVPVKPFDNPLGLMFNEDGRERRGIRSLLKGFPGAGHFPCNRMSRGDDNASLGLGRVCDVGRRGNRDTGLGCDAGGRRFANAVVSGLDPGWGGGVLRFRQGARCSLDRTGGGQGGAVRVLCKFVGCVGRRGLFGDPSAFWDEGVWINLADYELDDQLSSYYGGACSFHLAESAWGGGAWYPGATGPYGSSNDVGTAWDNRVSSVFIY